VGEARKSLGAVKNWGAAAYRKMIAVQNGVKSLGKGQIGDSCPILGPHFYMPAVRLF